jgi:multidrug efflux pump
MTIGTVFTLFVVPVFYSLIAAEHRPVVEEEEAGSAEVTHGALAPEVMVA